MTSTPDRPHATTEPDELASRQKWLRNQRDRLSNPRTAADKRTLAIIKRDLSEVDSELAHREWLAMDANYPIPKID